MSSRCVRKYGLLLVLLLSSGCGLFPHRLSAQSSPYPQSSVIGSLTFDWNSEIQVGNFPHNGGSDQWPMTWTDDGNMYGMWGDGIGWNGPDRCSMGGTSIGGTPPSLTGTDVWCGNDKERKPAAIIADANQTIYMFFGTPEDDWDGSYGGRSSDNGHTWDMSFPSVFARKMDGIKPAGIAQFGPGYSNVPAAVNSDYFYVYLADSTGINTYLGRVPKAQIYTRSAYTFFNGLDRVGDPIWSVTDRQPVFSDPAGKEYHINVIWNPGIGRFIYAKGHSVNQLAVFEGPNLWGPWKTLYYGPFRDNLQKFTYQIPPKWMSDDGLTMWMAWSGWPEYDNVNFVRAALLLTNGSPDVTPSKASSSSESP